MAAFSLTNLNHTEFAHCLPLPKLPDCSERSNLQSLYTLDNVEHDAGHERLLASTAAVEAEAGMIAKFIEQADISYLSVSALQLHSFIDSLNTQHFHSRMSFESDGYFDTFMSIDRDSRRSTSRYLQSFASKMNLQLIESCMNFSTEIILRTMTTGRLLVLSWTHAETSTK